MDATLQLIGNPVFFKGDEMMVGKGTSLCWPATEHCVVSAPMLIYTLLSRGAVESHACFCWDQAERIRPFLSSAPVIQRAVFVVAGWFRDRFCNLPLIEGALRCLRPDLQRVLCSASRHLRAVYGSIPDANRALKRAITAQWRLHRTTAFFDAWDVCRHAAVVQLVPVSLKSETPPDIVIDNSAGFVCCDVDKVILIATILFSEDVNFVSSWTKASVAVRQTAGVPPAIAEILDDTTSAIEAHTRASDQQ